MDFYFKCNGEEFRLPVPPREFLINKSYSHAAMLVEQQGEIGVIGNRKLANISITTLLPLFKYNFCSYTDFKEPYKYIEMFERWFQLKKPIRFYITKTNIDIDCLVEEFIYGERDGSGDVEISLKLKEYIPAGGARRSVEAPSKEVKKEETPKKVEERVYVVKKGDCLSYIAKREYGKASRWREIYEKNKSVIGADPDLIYPGQVFKL